MNNIRQSKESKTWGIKRTEQIQIPMILQDLPNSSTSLKNSELKSQIDSLNELSFFLNHIKL